MFRPDGASTGLPTFESRTSLVFVLGRRRKTKNGVGTQHRGFKGSPRYTKFNTEDSRGRLVIPSPGNSALLFHGLCRLDKIDWASESHQELDRCLSRTITASKNFND